jgi:hypothetical protein
VTGQDAETERRMGQAGALSVLALTTALAVGPGWEVPAPRAPGIGSCRVVHITNPGPGVAAVELSLRRPGLDAVPPHTYEDRLTAGETLRLVDPWSTLFGTSVPASALRVRATGPVVVVFKPCTGGPWVRAPVAGAEPGGRGRGQAEGGGP